MKYTENKYIVVNNDGQMHIYGTQFITCTQERFAEYNEVVELYHNSHAYDWCQ